MNNLNSKANLLLIEKAINRQNEKLELINTIIYNIEKVKSYTEFENYRNILIDNLLDIKDDLSESYQIMTTNLVLLKNYEEKLNISYINNDNSINLSSFCYKNSDKNNAENYNSLNNNQLLNNENKYMSNKNTINNYSKINSNYINNNLDRNKLSKEKELENNNILDNNRNNIIIPQDYSNKCNNIEKDTRSLDYKNNNIDTNNNLTICKQVILDPKLKQSSDKASRISNIFLNLYTYNDVKDILIQLHGDNLPTKLTEEKIDDDFLIEIEDTIKEIEKLREKDEVIEKEIEEYFQKEKVDPNNFYYYSNYNDLNEFNTIDKTKNLSNDKIIKEEKSEMEIDNDLNQVRNNKNKFELNLLNNVENGTNVSNKNTYNKLKTNTNFNTLNKRNSISNNNNNNNDSDTDKINCAMNKDNLLNNTIGHFNTNNNFDKNKLASNKIYNNRNSSSKSKSNKLLLNNSVHKVTNNISKHNNINNALERKKLYGNSVFLNSSINDAKCNTNNQNLTNNCKTDSYINNCSVLNSEKYNQLNTIDNFKNKINNVTCDNKDTFRYSKISNASNYNYTLNNEKPKNKNYNYNYIPKYNLNNSKSSSSNTLKRKSIKNFNELNHKNSSYYLSISQQFLKQVTNPINVSNLNKQKKHQILNKNKLTKF